MELWVIRNCVGLWKLSLLLVLRWIQSLLEQVSWNCQEHLCHWRGGGGNGRPARVGEGGEEKKALGMLLGAQSGGKPSAHTFYCLSTGIPDTGWEQGKPLVREKCERLGNSCEVELLHSVSPPQPCLCRSGAAAASMAARALINSRTVLNAAQVNAQAFFRSASTRLPEKEWERRRDQFTKLI